MIWVLSLLLFARTFEACQLNLQVGKQIEPIVSKQNGAKYLNSNLAKTQDLCHQGCCEVNQCDTSFYTGSQINKKGKNCHYFNCMGNCTIEVSPSNFSVSVIQIEDGNNGAVLENDESKTNNTLTTNDDSNTLTANDDDSNTLTANDDSLDDSVSDKDVLSEEKVNLYPASNVTSEIEGMTNDTATIALNNGKPGEVSADITESVTNPDGNSDHTSDETSPEDKQPDIQEPDAATNTSSVDATHHDENTAPAKETDDDLALDDKKPVTQPHPTKGNENMNSTHSSVNETISEQKVNDVFNSSGISTDLKVEIDIHDGSKAGRYTVKDVVFWVSVVGGAGLILFGLAMIIRVYRNKRRRLYSSLTDDYLINGMYSI